MAPKALLPQMGDKWKGLHMHIHGRVSPLAEFLFAHIIAYGLTAGTIILNIIAQSVKGFRK